MRSKNKTYLILKFFVLFIALACVPMKNLWADEDSKYLEAVREFADNVLKYGRDTYGPKHTPLFVDGVNVNTHEPVKWIAPNGDRWILSNLASQQNLFRTLDGLSTITGDPKYRQSAMEAIEYAFGNLRSGNGLLYWGNTTAYDAQGDEAVGQRMPKDYTHVLKANLPYYELMWQVNPEATKTFIEAFWSAHVKNWSNLAMNRIGEFNDALEEPWKHTYEDGPVFLKSGSGLSFLNAGTDLIYAAAMLTKLSGDKEPLVWAKRLAHRYVRTRHPKTGISYWMYTEPPFTALDSYDTVMRKLVPGTTEFLPSEFPWAFYSNPLFREVVRGQFTPTPGISIHQQVFYWQTQFLVGEMLAGDGDEFKQWALEELTAFGRASYREKDNAYVPILTDGTNLEGYVVKVDTGLLGPKGVALEPVPVRFSDLWAYTMGYRITNDTFMWEMVRNISKGNQFGDIGLTSNDRPQLNRDTNCSNPYALLSFLELSRGTGKNEFLYMAKRIGDNILGSRFHKGFFVASNEHIYTKFDAIDSLALLRLHLVLAGDIAKISDAWPSLPYFYCSYRSKEWTNDNAILYTRIEPSDPPLSLLEAVSLGDIEKVRAIISRDSDVNARENSFFKTSLHEAAIKGHKNIVELLLAAKDIDVNAGDASSLTPLHYAVEKGHKDIVEVLLTHGADVNAKDDQGRTPIDIAMRNARMDIASVLIDNGAEASFLTKMRVNMARAAEEQKAKEAESSIHVAAQNGDQEKVETLLEQGVGVNAKDSDGKTALYYATRGGHGELAQLLIEKGADVTVKDTRGITPLYFAATSGMDTLVELIIAHDNIDVNVQTDLGWTPLHMAAAQGHRGVVQFLVNHGADVSVKKKDGKTPLDLAKQRGHTEIVAILAKAAEEQKAAEEKQAEEKNKPSSESPDMAAEK